jgi:septal ring factor EnvC (AmiA/AmiB activator)
LLCILQEKTEIDTITKAIAELNTVKANLQTQADDNQRRTERRAEMGIESAQAINASQTASQQVATSAASASIRIENERQEVLDLTKRLLCLQSRAAVLARHPEKAAADDGCQPEVNKTTTAHAKEIHNAAAEVPRTNQPPSLVSGSEVYVNPNTGKIVAADFAGPKVKGHIVNVIAQQD